jgi:hypothetical protein
LVDSNEKRLVRVQRLLGHLRQQTNELKRLVAVADKRRHEPTATINLLRRKKR